MTTTIATQPTQTKRHDVVGVEIMGQMIMCDVVDVFSGPPRSIAGYVDALVVARAPKEVSVLTYRVGGPYVVGFLTRDNAAIAPVFRVTLDAALRDVSNMPWEQGCIVRH